MPETTQLLKKIIISIFIVCFLWVTIYSNLNIILKTHIAAPPLEANASFSSFAKIAWSKFNYGLGWLGSFLAVKNVWNMFGVIDKSTWSITMVGIDQNGDQKTIMLPYSANTTGWKDNFFNFRESKVFQNFNGNLYLQNLYAQYLCKRDPSLKSVKFLHTSDSIIPPDNLGENNYFKTGNTSVNFYLCQT